MADNILKTTSKGGITLEITLNGEAAMIPSIEVFELIAILRETADNLEEMAAERVVGQVLSTSNLIH